MPDRYAWLRQMDNTNVNLAALKTFAVTERWKFAFRGEAFNLLNHPLYGAPSSKLHCGHIRAASAGSAELPAHRTSFGAIAVLRA